MLLSRFETRQIYKFTRLSHTRPEHYYMHISRFRVNFECGIAVVIYGHKISSALAKPTRSTRSSDNDERKAIIIDPVRFNYHILFSISIRTYVRFNLNSRKAIKNY